MANIGREIKAISQDINIKTENYPVYAAAHHTTIDGNLSRALSKHLEVSRKPCMLHEEHAFKTALSTAARVATGPRYTHAVWRKNKINYRLERS